MLKPESHESAKKIVEAQVIAAMQKQGTIRFSIIWIN